MECMHETCKDGCPSLLLQSSDVALDCICDPCMANCPSKYQHTPHVHGMQQGKDKRVVQQPEPTPTAILSNNGSLLGSKFLDTHSDEPKSETHTHSLKHPTSPCHSHHAHSITYPPRPRLRDGEP